jgi:hypothetical protein
VALVCALAYAASASSAGAAIIKQISPKVKTWVRQATFWGGARLRREGKRRLKAGGGRLQPATEVSTFQEKIPDLNVQLDL